MDREFFPHSESELDRMLKSKEAEGWHFVGREKLTRTKFSAEAKFEEIIDQTEESITERYLEQARQQDPSSKFEVELVLDEGTEKLRKLRKISTEEEYQVILANLSAQDKSYFVFVRKVKV